nr:pentatricopeptide repeat-containing protein At1g77360, mitochondrial-like [Tanacetum cinerariifolium]
MSETRKRRHTPSPTTKNHHPIFPSHTTIPNLPVKIKLLCDIIATTPSSDIDKTLNDTGIIVTTENVEDVLKLCYSYPSPAVMFFRWSGYQLNDKHSPYSWNLVIDMLGKNCLFDAMWDAINSMMKEDLLSLATFASVFASYVLAGEVEGAIEAFQVMGKFGLTRDIVALNTLLTVICRDGRPKDAMKFLDFVRRDIRPDGDSYAILLEGWENEGDGVNAKVTFREMVGDVGWHPGNFEAYDSFLIALLKGSGGLSEAMECFEDLSVRKCYPGVRFFKSALNECAIKGDVKRAEVLWDTVTVGKRCNVDTELYNSMILVYCYVQEFVLARRLLDEMVFKGVYPDLQSYNIMFKYLLKGRKLDEAILIFREMVKNEFVPAHANCCLALKLVLDDGDPYTAIKVWKCMIENYVHGIEEMGNILVNGLRDLNHVPEAVKYAEAMIERGIKVSSSTLSRLRQSLVKAGKGPVYDELLRKWKLH